jgi:hypothetical protein
MRLAATVIAAVTVAGAASVAFAAPSRPVTISDPGDDAGGALDLTRVSFQRASDGRLRAVFTFAEKITPAMLLAESGPPGSACLRIWTEADADPKAMRPDRLVCVTARSRDALRGGVYEVRGAALPRRVADASVKRNSSGRSLVVRFTQSSIARPQRIRFAVESTRPGCARPSCIDTVPDKGAVRMFRLR